MEWVIVGTTFVVFFLLGWFCVGTDRAARRAEAAARRSQRAEVESGVHLIRAQARARLRS